MLEYTYVLQYSSLLLFALINTNTNNSILEMFRFYMYQNSFVLRSRGPFKDAVMLYFIT